MKRTVALAVMAALAALPAVVPNPGLGEECPGFCAGAAKADITPPVGTPGWGYSARALYAQPDRWAEQRITGVDTDLYAKALFLRGEGVHTRLYARALVLRNAAGAKTALVQVDLGAVTGEVHRAVANAAAPLGIARDAILISATHTHGGPGTIQQPAAHGLLVGDHYDPRTFKRVVDGIVRAVTRADEALTPARIGIGQGRLLGASVNRSMRQHARGSTSGETWFGPDPCPDPEAYETDPCLHRVNGEGPAEEASDPHAIDPLMTMIRVDARDGRPLGVWTNFAAHGTMFWSEDLRLSGDNQGYAARMIEQGIAARAGLDAADLVAAYSNGTEGDIAPAGSGANRFAAAEDSGRRQAEAALAVYDALADEMRDDVELGARWDWLHMIGEGGTSPVAILGAGPDCPFGSGTPWPAEGVPGHGRKCPFLVLSGTGAQYFGLQVLRIGDLVMGGIPGEMTVQMGRRVKKRLLARAPEGTIPVIAGLANDYMAYLTTPEEYDVQDYEATFTLWGRAQGPYVRDRIGDLADRLFLGEPNPPFVEPPDTSGLQSENVSASELVERAAPGTPAGTILLPPPSIVERGEVAAMAWAGGSPAVEAPVDEPFVETQRREGEGWRTVFWDEGYEDLIDYRRVQTEDHWGVQWDVPFGVPTGRYRFLVHGHTFFQGVDEPPSDSARVVPYSAVSEFDVVASDDLAVASVEPGPEGLRLRVVFRAPSGSDQRSGEVPAMHECSAVRGTAVCNYRWRAAGPTTPTATAAVVVDGGDPQIVTGTYAGAPGTYDFSSVTSSDVAVAAFTDGDGNGV